MKLSVTGSPVSIRGCQRGASLSSVNLENFVFAIQAFWRNSKWREKFAFNKERQIARRLVRRSGRQRLLWRKLVAVLAAHRGQEIIIAI